MHTPSCLTLLLLVFCQINFLDGPVVMKGKADSHGNVFTTLSSVGTAICCLIHLLLIRAVEIKPGIRSNYIGAASI